MRTRDERGDRERRRHIGEQIELGAGTSNISFTTFVATEKCILRKLRGLPVRLTRVPGAALRLSGVSPWPRADDTPQLSVLRAHLIERLIGSGTSELIFWSGCAPPLSRYATPIPAMAVYLDTPAFGWRLIRSMVGKTQPWMPKSIAADLRWMTGAELLSEPPEYLSPGREDRVD